MRIVYKGNYIRMTCGEIGLVYRFNGRLFDAACNVIKTEVTRLLRKGHFYMHAISGESHCILMLMIHMMF